MIKEKEDAINDFASFYESTMRHFREGEILKGRIVEIRSKEVLVDIGYKSEGVIPVYEFEDPSALKVGDEVEVLLESKENEHGMLVLSREKAKKTTGWESISYNCKEGDLIQGKVTRKIKGGYIVDIGIEAFLPTSLSNLKGYGNIDAQFGQVLDFKIAKINKARKNVVLSRKDALQEQVQKERSKVLSELIKGQVIAGTVKNITDFGAFVDVGGVDGLLHITDMSWGRIGHPSEVVKVGDRIEVMILEIDKTSNKISLGLKQKSPNPWLDVDAKYPVGSRLKGKVTNLLPYGAFVELEKGVEGLVHVSEMSWKKRISHPNELLKAGDEVEVVVLDIDRQNQRISLGIKQLEQDPWGDIETRYIVGSKVKGKVRNLVDYGAFVELEEGLDGLVHVSDMSWTRKILHPREVLKKGDEVEALVLSVDKANRKIALGIKQLLADPWPEIANELPNGIIVDGTVTKIVNFGVFVELRQDLEGLVHISELRQDSSGKLDTLYKVGQKVRVRVLKVDVEQKKIALSNRDV
ncbi:MAG: 30S ribosomal protein S1 [Candidatus Omnitrophica bacterium]|nr:30S ribosomal protein S1 [Candidatus Omnitrophota bacterium]